MTLYNLGLCFIAFLISISNCFGQKIADTMQMTVFGFELEKPLTLRECQELLYGGPKVGDAPASETQRVILPGRIKPQD